MQNYYVPWLDLILLNPQTTFLTSGSFIPLIVNFPEKFPLEFYRSHRNCCINLERQPQSMGKTNLVSDSFYFSPTQGQENGLALTDPPQWVWGNDCGVFCAGRFWSPKDHPDLGIWHIFQPSPFWYSEKCWIQGIGNNHPLNEIITSQRKWCIVVRNYHCIFLHTIHHARGRISKTKTWWHSPSFCPW